MSKNRVRKRRSGRSSSSKVISIIRHCDTLRKVSGSRTGRGGRQVLGRATVPATYIEKTSYAEDQLFSTLSASEIRSGFGHIAKHKYFRKLVNLTDCQSLKYSYEGIDGNTCLEKDLIWFSLLIKHHSEKLNFFVESEARITSFILSEKWEKALKLVSEVDRVCGASTWSAFLVAAIESEDDVAVSGGEELSRILDEVSDNTYLRNILQYGSAFFRNEDIYIKSSETNKKEIIRSVDDLFRDHLLFKMFSFDFNYDYDFSKLAHWEKKSSIVDIFLFFIKYFSTAVFKRGGTDFSRQEREVLLSVSNSVDHPLLKSLSLLVGAPRQVDDREVDLMDAYLVGDYQLVCDISERFGIENLSFPAFMTLARSLSHGGVVYANSLWMIILDDLKKVITRDEDFEAARQRLMCLSYCYRSLSWFDDLGIFLQMEGDFLSISQRVSFENILSLRWRGVSPSILPMAHKSIYEDVLSWFREDRPNSVSVSFYQYLSCAKKDRSFERKLRSNGVPDYRLVLSLAPSKIIEGKHVEVTENLYMLLTSKDRMVIRDAYSHLVLALLAGGKVDKAVSLFVDQAIEDRGLSTVFDIGLILSKTSTIFKRSNSIDYPIAFSIYSRNKGSDYDSMLKYSFEVFLSRNGFVLPQELISKEDVFGRDRLHYFIKNVCTQDVMRLYLGFAGMEEIESCRVDLCLYLMTCGDESLSLKNEIKEINRSKVIKLAAKKVDESRIYVDTSLFLGRDSSQFKVLFDSFLELRSQGVRGEDDDVFETLYGKFSYREAQGLFIQNVGLNKRNATFLSLIKLIRDEFLYGERGLNNHLSTRIRHGVFPNNFRQPLVDENLFYSGDKADFLSKSSFSSGPVSFSSAEAPSVCELISDFSVSYESLIDEINDLWFQIYTVDSMVSSSKAISDSSKAMFNYQISSFEGYMLQKELELGGSYEDFVEKVVSWLWSKTDENLTLLKERIRDEACSRGLEMLDGLRKKSEDVLGKTPALSNLCNSIERAKVKLLSQVDLICSWFERSDSVPDGDYDLMMAFDIAAESLSVKYVKSEHCTCNLAGRNLVYAVDFVFILFENALSKSGLSREDLEFRVDTRIDAEDRLQLTFMNRVSSGWSGSSDLEFYLDAYGDEQLIKDSIQGEGGTGFFKIWKILKKDMGLDHEISIECEDDTFSVVLTIDRAPGLDWEETS